jgi:hypothetical protein
MSPADPVTVAELHQDALDLINPQGKPRQWVAAAVERRVGTRIGGWVLTRSKSGHWEAATYALVEAEEGQYRAADLLDRVGAAQAQQWIAHPFAPLLERPERQPAFQIFRLQPAVAQYRQA